MKTGINTFQQLSWLVPMALKYVMPDNTLAFGVDKNRKKLTALAGRGFGKNYNATAVLIDSKN